jgi:hypothetical protein
MSKLMQKMIQDLECRVCRVTDVYLDYTLSLGIDTAGHEALMSVLIDIQENILDTHLDNDEMHKRCSIEYANKNNYKNHARMLIEPLLTLYFSDLTSESKLWIEENTNLYEDLIRSLYSCYRAKPVSIFIVSNEPDELIDSSMAAA